MLPPPERSARKIVRTASGDTECRSATRVDKAFFVQRHHSRPIAAAKPAFSPYGSNAHLPRLGSDLLLFDDRRTASRTPIALAAMEQRTFDFGTGLGNRKALPVS